MPNYFLILIKISINTMKMYNHVFINCLCFRDTLIFDTTVKQTEGFLLYHPSSRKGRCRREHVDGHGQKVIGFNMTIVVCTLPTWIEITTGDNLFIWEGLWMRCVTKSTGQMQCKVYDSMLALSQDLQAARALTVISILLAILAVLIAITGAKCTNCIEDEASKAKVMIISGVFFIVSGVMQLIPVSWSANTIIRDFYNPLLTDAQRRELGAALYIGWGASALMILGGSLLCCSCPPREKRYNPSRMAYSVSRSAPGGPGFERKDYV